MYPSPLPENENDSVDEISYLLIIQKFEKFEQNEITVFSFPSSLTNGERIKIILNWDLKL
jgi:hypothetical protein